MSQFDFLLCIKKIKERYLGIVEQLALEQYGSEKHIELLKEARSLERPIAGINAYIDTVKEMEALDSLDPSDKELFQYALEEKKLLAGKLTNLEKVIRDDMCPNDEEEEGNAIIEVRAGTGGAEASLFAAELFKMYLSYASSKGWKVEVLSAGETGIGGYREACALINGHMAFAKLNFEAGVHRVQRVPATEAKGRIHTSTATVAVLPEAKEIQVNLDDKDIRIETCRASGAGGQHVNTTDSAVRIVHVPTGISVVQQDERSQHKNKSKAIKVLRSRILDFERRKLFQERGDSRKEQIGSGDRSEKIRTYNFPQNRVTDHRINFTVHAIESVLSGAKLDEIISMLENDSKGKRLSQFFAKFN